MDKYYSKDGKKVGGEVDLNTSYKHLLGQCKDFREEQSQLEKIADSYGYEVWFTPKYHCEFAGEGIEYMWGYMKLLYRRIPKKDKNKKENFIASVKRIVNRETVTAVRIRRFSRRARRYIRAYYVKHMGKDEDVEGERAEISLKLVEEMVKKFETQRCALDFAYKIVKQEAERC